MKTKFYVVHGIMLPIVLFCLYVLVVRDHSYWGAGFLVFFWGLQMRSDYLEMIKNGNRNTPELDSGSVGQRGCCTCSCHESNAQPPVEVNPK